MARAGRGGNTSLRGAVGGGSGPVGLFLAAIFLGPFLLIAMAHEDRRKRGIPRTRQDIAEMLAIGATVLAIDAFLIFVFFVGVE